MLTSNKPHPTTQSFVVCREIIQDRHTEAAILFHPFQKLNFPGFPATFPVSLFIQLTGGHGTYRLAVQLQDANGEVLGEVIGPRDESLTDPVAYFQVYWRDVRFKFPRPGQYALVLLADREEIGRHALELAHAIKG